MRVRTCALLVGVAAALALTLSACGGGSDDTDTDTDSATSLAASPTVAPAEPTEAPAAVTTPSAATFDDLTGDQKQRVVSACTWAESAQVPPASYDGFLPEGLIEGHEPGDFGGTLDGLAEALEEAVIARSDEATSGALAAFTRECEAVMSDPGQQAFEDLSPQRQQQVDRACTWAATAAAAPAGDVGYPSDTLYLQMLSGELGPAFEEFGDPLNDAVSARDEAAIQAVATDVAGACDEIGWTS